MIAIAIVSYSLAGSAQNEDRDRYTRYKTSANAPPPEGRIDINHASIDELLKAPGMTRSWAGRIIRFRPYRSKLDLVDNGVLTTQAYDRIEGYVIAHREAK